ncbi:MAG: hypothetical protein OEU92_02445 [Alphaproteobacteria bacterium]|nr:hypothetical protein [Alphaproteobacteria bacterium]
MTLSFRPISGLFGTALLLTAAWPATADEIEDTITTALEAYQAGDVAGAKSEIDYVAQLLSQKQAESLMTVLPAPFDGWSQEAKAGEAAAGMAMFGGGLSAGADYRKNGHNVEIQLLADSPMMAAMMAMFANPAMAGAAGGKLKRLAGQKVIETQDGEIQAMVHNRFMVQITGSAPIEDKEAYFNAIDFDTLSTF